MRLLLPDVREIADDELPDLYDAGGGTFLRAGLVSSADGVVAVDGSSRPLSSPGDQAVLRALRTVADAVVVGAGTARAEDYGPITHRPAAAAWRSAHGRSAAALLVVVTRTGVLPPQARTGPVLVVAPDTAVLPADVDVLRAGADDVDLARAVQLLHARGLARLHCEGGPALFTGLLRAQLVDELCLTVAPTVVGAGPHLLAGGLPAPVGLELVSLLHAPPGPLLARWRVVRS